MANIGAVNVTVTISPEGARRREFGRTLYVDRVDAAVTEKQHAELIRGVHTYTSSDAVSKAGWPAATRKAADVYFQQVPFPRNLLIGTRTSVAQPSLIFGTALATAVAIEALGDIDVTLNGQAVRFAFDSISTTDYDAILAAITSAINGLDGFSNVTVSVDNGALVIQDPDGGSFGTGFAQDANTDALGLSDATVLEKMDQETLRVGLDRIESIDPSAYWIGLDPVSTLVEADAIDFANWVAARNYATILDVVKDGGVLTTGENASIGAKIYALGQENVSLFYNGDAIDFKALSYMGRFSSVNFAGSNTVITGKFKELPGTTPTPLTQTQKDELDRKRINHYTAVGDGFDTAEGVSCGTWIDVRHFTDWLKNAMQVDAYAELKAADAVPQTDAGQGIILGAAIGVLEQGVTNGGIAPNRVSNSMRADIIAATGADDFDGFLSTGYMAFSQPFAQQSQTDREARKGMPIRAWVKGSGKIHFVDIAINIEN